jgi:hypothetical protein
LFSDAWVKRRSAWMALPYVATALADNSEPGGWFMKGINLSGNPGIVHPMQIPPTLGQPPIPAIHPRFPTLH